MPAKSIFLFVVVGIMSFSIGAFTALQIMKSGYSGAKDITFPEVIDGGESIDIFDIPSDVFTKRDLRSARLTHNSFWETIYRDGARQRHVTYSNHEISSLEFSPITGDKLGFFYYPNDNAVTDISLAIMYINFLHHRYSTMEPSLRRYAVCRSFRACVSIDRVSWLNYHESHEHLQRMF